MRPIIIIPAYNEEENILNVYNNIKNYNDNHNEKYDYVIINDGSKDNTLKILQENNLNHINLIHNLGIGGAVQTGYKYAYYNNYDIAIQFDGDGQHDINYVSKIIEPIKNGQADLVIGSRYLDKSSSEFQSTFMRRLGGSIISFFIKICTGKKITDPTSGFRAANKKIIKEFSLEYPTEYPEPESTVCMLCKKNNIIEVPVSMNEREGGKSSIRFLKTADYMVKVVLAIIVDSINIKRIFGGKK